MCDATVLTLGALAIRTAGNIGGAIAQNKNSAANEAAAIQSQANQVNDINLRELQEKQAAGQQIEQAQRQTTTALSSARLTAGEAGVSGASVDALLNDIGREGSTFSEDVKLNEKMTQQQLERQKLGIYAQTTDRINSVPKANPLATALKIGGDAIGALADLQGRNPPSDGDVPSSVSAPSVATGLRIGSRATPKFTMPQLRIPYGK